MAPGIANTLDILVHQQEAQAETIRNLIALCRAHGLPELKLASALKPLVEGPVPAQEQGPGNTEPMEMDNDVSPLRKDGRRTVEVRTLSDQELLDERRGA